MNIHFKGKYKSITNFDWTDIPRFAVLTGPNGTGKTQLLELVYYTIINGWATDQRVVISGLTVDPNEVTFLKGEWNLTDTNHSSFATIQNQAEEYYRDFITNFHGHRTQYDINRLRKEVAFANVLKNAGKPTPNMVSREEFNMFFPDMLIEYDTMISQKVSEAFINYRLSEIELQAEQKTPAQIRQSIGEKPWDVLREIIKEAKLPFSINDPSKNGLREGFQLKLHHNILNEDVGFSQLSSGEKVLISLVLYLYTSQEKNVFPKLLLLDEPDAHLHPSMSQQFLNVIRNVLVERYFVQVIMTTHSPSTVVLSPKESIFLMSKLSPRIVKPESKNQAVSLLTSGLVYVGEGTKYFLVEDEIDAHFYSYIFDNLMSNLVLDTSIPVVFIPASTKEKSGGKNVVQAWVQKLQQSGLTSIVQGLIDRDNGSIGSQGIFTLDRYSVENYLIDPIIVFAALIDKEYKILIPNINIPLGEEYKLKSMSNEDLQRIADSILALVEPKLENYFSDFDNLSETARIEVCYLNGSKLLYPNWLFNRRGKTILQHIYNDIFNSTIINFKTLFKSFKKLNMFPMDIISKLKTIQEPSII